MFFCHRFFELRFLVATNILGELSKYGVVTLLLPKELASSYRTILKPNPNIKVAISLYEKSDLFLWTAWLNFWGDILYLTFPNTDKNPNATAKFHRQHYRSKSILKRALVVNISRFISHFSRFLPLIVWLYQVALPRGSHQVLLEKERPDLMIGCSFGLSLEDAIFLKEAQANRIPSAVVVQSWDRTSNKGCPTVWPDHVLVWNKIMEREAIVNLGFKKESIHVVGSALWDTHFKKLKIKPCRRWRKKLSIPQKTKILFFACGGFGNHAANMTVIPSIFELAQTQPFHDDIHIVFRVYPQYLSPVTRDGDGKRKKNELEELLSKYKNESNITILYPNVDFDGKNFIPNEQDHYQMTECLYQCDVSLSQVSSQMIEACIFDKPALNIEFGRRQTEKYDLEIKEYKTEHLLRVYRTGAIYRVQNQRELQATIAQALSKPAEKCAERKALVDQEAPCNKGVAAAKTAKRLADLARKKHR